MKLNVLSSKIDNSVNFVEEQLTGFLESRYVRKRDDNFICYLSSQTGCNRGCQFCHLTVTNQTSFVDSTHNDFIGQALQVYKYYKTQKPAKYMHYSFMARGEPLSNQVLLNSADQLLFKLAELAKDVNLPCKFNLSTIMPLTLKKSLVDIFKFITPTIYYSLYSANPNFRNKWIPASLPVEESFRLLKEYQDFSKKIIKIHHAFIDGENDSDEDVKEICNLVDKYNLITEFNLVRYNPASIIQGKETSEERLQQILTTFQSRFKGKVQMIQRVGFDVKASCGMFV